jgi:hypothetical protein
MRHAQPGHARQLLLQSREHALEDLEVVAAELHRAPLALQPTSLLRTIDRFPDSSRT